MTVNVTSLLRSRGSRWMILKLITKILYNYLETYLEVTKLKYNKSSFVSNV